MAHAAQLAFVKLVATDMRDFFVRRKVCEIGSLDINGAVRGYYTDCDYTGIDVAPGKNVDVVCEGQKYAAPADSFDQVISCEVMEHNPYWAATFDNMIRLCKPGGLVVMSCATIGRPEHGTARTRPGNSPLTVELGWNYYRNLTRRDFERATRLRQVFAEYRFWTNWASFDLYFCGLKRGGELSAETRAQWAALVRDADAHIAAANRLKICRYRSVLAGMFGDRWFSAMRGLSKTLDYMHNA